MVKLLVLARLTEVDFDAATKEDIKRIVALIDSQHEGWSRIKLRTILRHFIKWERQRDDCVSTDEYPEEVRWIKRGAKSKDLKHVSKQECWNEEEMLRLVAVAASPRDAAIACRSSPRPVLALAK